jgi:hypothetical protein
MVRFRSFVWLLALAAFALSSFGTASLGHAAVPADHAAMADCPDHPPPPDCPAQDTAKHAAGQCCPLMVGVVALLPPAVSAETLTFFRAPVAAPIRSLVGLSSKQDPPPPRV